MIGLCKLLTMSAILRHLTAVGLNRILVFILLLWLVILLFAALPMLNTHLPANSDTKTMERLNRALADLELLRKQNTELQEIFRDIAAGYTFLLVNLLPHVT